MIIQAHPLREAEYIDHIRLFPRVVHGVEVLNASQPEFRNAMAEMYAKHYELLPFAGSDNHNVSARKQLAGMQFDCPLEDEADFVARVKRGEGEIFFLNCSEE